MILARQNLMCGNYSKLKKKYKNLIYGKDTDSKPLKRVAEELNKRGSKKCIM